MAQFLKTIPQEAVLIRGSIIEETQDYYWIVDVDGNRLAVTWRKDYADRLADAVSVLEELDAQEARWQQKHKGDK